ncbi:RNA polymerase sigma factor [Nocardioides conyzicola]|uniref:RNA polymerase sigma factor n=1 Tax=Nocardioides conyzicola TaxID=1651781 RepID=A0ABP8Y1W9_9ACTN
MSTPDPPPSDPQVVAASVHDPSAFAEIYSRHADDVHRYLRRRLGSDVADDLTADTFVAAFGARARFDLAAASARPWLFGIASNLAAKHRRSEIRGLRAFARTGVDPVASEWSDGADDRVSAQALNRELAAALSELSAGDRDVLLLVAWAELSYAEVAAALQLPVGTVRSRLNRARRTVRTTLSPGTERVAIRPLTALETRGGPHG